MNNFQESVDPKYTMNLIEAEDVLYKLVEDDIDLSGNLTLLRRFIAVYIETAWRESQSVSFIFGWYKSFFHLHSNNKWNENGCILAIIMLEKLLESNCFASIASDRLFSQIMLPFQGMIMNHDNSAINGSCEILLSFYKIHQKLAANIEHVKQVKKYGLWKPLVHFYLKNDKFVVPIQNICSEYLSSLLSSENMPDELFLLFDIITLNARHIKVNVANSKYNDQNVYRSLRLLNLALSKSIAKLNQKAFNLVSRKCHSLYDDTLKLALSSNNDAIIKYALIVYVLLKYCSIAGDEYSNHALIFEFLIDSVSDTLTDPKFVKYIPELCNLLKEIFYCPFIQDLWIQVQVSACNLYLKNLSFAVNLLPHKVETDSEEVIHFVKKFESQLRKTSDLSKLIDLILKTISNTDSHLSEDNKIHLICYLNSVLKCFVCHDGWFFNDLSNILINVIHGIRTLLMKFELTSRTDIFDTVFKTSIGICHLEPHNRMDIKLAAYNLCRVTIIKYSQLSESHSVLLKQMIIDAFQDPRWEVRDCVLELITEVFGKFPNIGKELMADEQFSKVFLNTLFDEESYVRASAYKVLSILVLISLPIQHPIVDCEKLLLKTVTEFPKETESIVRVGMLTFIKLVWEHAEITNTSLLMDVYQTVYFASSVDLYDEVRRYGMLFWYQLVQSFLGRNEEANNDSTEFLDKLAAVGCFQAVMNAIEDEYDLEVLATALNILDLLILADTSCKNCSQPEERHLSVKPLITHNAEKISNNILSSKTSPNDLPSIECSRSYISREEFLNKYNRTQLEQMKTEKLCQTESLNLEDLLDCFKRVTFNDDVNEKDCY